MRPRHQHATRVLMAPLERLLAEGLADGSFPLADPVADAPLIQSVAWAAAGLSPMQERPHSTRRGVATGALVLRARAGSYAFSVRDQRAGSPSSTRIRPSSSSTRRCDTASPTAARRMNPSMSSHLPRPLHVRRDIPGAVGAVAQDGDDLFETVPMVLAQLFETAVQVGEAVLVRRQHLLHLVGLELVE